MARGISDLELKLTGSPAVVAGLRSGLLLKAFSGGKGAWTRHHVTYPVEVNQAQEAAPEPVPSITTVFDRWSQPVRFSSSLIELKIDLGRVEVSNSGNLSNSAALAEITLVLTEGSSTDVFDLARLLVSNAALRVSRLSSEAFAKNFYAGGEYHLPKSPKIVFTGEETGGEALQHLLMLMADRVCYLAPLITEVRNPKAVQQMRVALRRLRAVERSFRPYLNDAKFRKIVQQAKYYGKVLGPARDWDVFLDETTPSVLRGDYAPEGASRLAVTGASARAEQWAEAAPFISDPAFNGFVIDLAEAASLGGRWRGAEEHQPIKSLAPAILERRLRKAKRLSRRIDRSQLAAWHDLRISLKKLRYPVQMFRSLYPKETRQSYMAAMSWLQDSFGHINDATLAQSLADDAATGEGGDAMRAAGFIAGYKAAQAQAAAQKLEEDWAAFEAMVPFWRER